MSESADTISSVMKAFRECSPEELLIPINDLAMVKEILRRKGITPETIPYVAGNGFSLQIDEWNVYIDFGGWGELLRIRPQDQEVRNGDADTGGTDGSGD